MTAAPGPRWNAMAEVGSIFGLQFLFWIYRLFGRLPFRLALYPVLAWYFATRSIPRQASQEFLGKALGRPARKRDGLRHFLAFAEAMLDKLIAWNGGFSLSDVEFRGREHLAALLEKGQGCILIGSHLGNMEICRVLSRWRPGMELHVLVHTRHSQNWNRVLQRLDPSSQFNLHQVSELDAGSGAWMAERVARGAVLVIAGDRVPLAGDRVSEAPFFRDPAPFAEGPYLLAHALGCPVLLFFCLRQGPGFTADFEPFADRVALPRGPQRKVALAELVARYAGRLEAHASRNPFQWFNFFPYWQKKSALP